MRCPQCNAVNHGGRIICNSCGGSLEIAASSAKTLKRKSVALRLLVSGLKLAAVLAVLAVIAGFFLCLWSTDPTGTTAATANDGLKQVKAMEALVGGIGADLEAGKTARVEFTEVELNSYFGKRRSQDYQIVVDLRSDALVCHVTTSAEPISLGVVTLSPTMTFELQCLVAAAPDGGLLFKVHKARTGALPMRGPGVEKATAAVVNAFASMTPERELLTKLRQLKIADDKVQAIFKP